VCVYLFINNKKLFSNHSLSRSNFPSCFNVIKIISLHELAKPNCTCTKWFIIIIIILWQILINRKNICLNQNSTYRHVALILISKPWIVFSLHSVVELLAAPTFVPNWALCLIFSALLQIVHTPLWAWLILWRMSAITLLF
jgi:hypothetical protein